MTMPGIDSSFWKNGPSPGSLYNFPNCNDTEQSNDHLYSTPLNRTLQPMVTGTSVLGVKFKDGVLLACDTLGSYGSMARFTNISRILCVNDSTVLGAGGDFADFQFIKSAIEQKVISDECIGDNFRYTPLSLHSWLTRVYYNRRSRFNPLWNTLVIAGLQNDEPYLGYLDKIGTAYESPSVATGYGSYIAQPLLREFLEKHENKFKKVSLEDAKEIIAKCMSVLFYRDARSWNKYELAIIRKNQPAIVEGPILAESEWEIARNVKGYE